MNSPKLKDNFTILLEKFNEPNVKEALCLYNCMTINKRFNQEEIKNYNIEEVYSFLESNFSNALYEKLKPQNYEFIKEGHLKYDDSLMNDFNHLKFSYNFPKFKDFPPQADLKKILINKINDILDNDQSIVYGDLSAKYASYVFFTIRHIINYCVKFDNDFEKLSHKFPGYSMQAQLDNPNFSPYINSLLKSYGENPDNIVVTKAINSLSNILSTGYKAETIIIPQFGSHQKGQLGESIYSSINNSENVGYKNNKTDLIENGEGISLKSSFTKFWNSHLAYLNESEHKSLISQLEGNKPLSKLSINWKDIIEKLITNNEDIKYLVFQKLTLNELDKEPKEIKLWKLDINEITNIIDNKQFVFTNNSITLYHEQEQLMKISFKKRTGNIQVLVSTDENSLKNAVDNGLGIYEVPVIEKRKNKI